MPAVHLHQSYALEYAEKARAASRRTGEAYAAYIGRVNELAGHARAKTQELWQAYLQAARAAMVGDDAYARTAAAYQDFQREYAKLESEYVRSVTEAYGTFASSVAAADSNGRLAMLDDYIAYLTALRGEMAHGAPPDAPSDRD